MDLFNKIIVFLQSIPNIQSSSERKAFLYSASLDKGVLAQIEIDGPTAKFCQLLVHTLADYGTLNDGRGALESLLQAAKNNVGQEGKQSCNELIQQLKGRNQHDGYKQSKNNRKDWGAAPDVSVFFGRTQEIEILSQWILNEDCRLLAILGIAGIGKSRLSAKLRKGGIGKTDLSAKLKEEIQEHFDFVIWERLLDAPPINKILVNIIKILSEQQEIELPNSIDALISRVIFYLRKYRCLLILDNIDSVLCGGDSSEHYKNGYEGYGDLLKHVGEVEHRSCVLLTSREKPQEIAMLEGKTKPVRSIELKGLDEAASRELIAATEKLSGSDEDWKTLIKIYNGNPFALELATKHIKDIFRGNISDFLREGNSVFNNLQKLLDWHFNRLANNEKEVLYWLSINRVPISLKELKKDILSPQSKEQLSSSLQLLQRRLPLETSWKGFTLQPILIEYVTARLIDNITKEIESGELSLLNTHALIKALAPNYVRETQTRLILEPIRERLLLNFVTKAEVEIQLKQLLSNLREQIPRKLGYAGANILHLLISLKSNLSDFDFSHLPIQQAYLQGINLLNVNFMRSHIVDSIFTQPFGNVLTVAFSPTGNLLATGNVNGEIRLWRMEDSQPTLTIAGHSEWVRSVLFSPDGQTLASCGEDKTVKLWDVSDGRCRAVLEKHTGRVWTLAFSPDGDILASGGDDNTVILWNVETMQHIKILGKLDNWVRSIAFNSDGSMIAVGSEDSTVSLWNIHTGQREHIFDKYPDNAHGHKARVRTVAFSSDRNLLASGGTDCTVKLWNVQTAKCLNTLEEHKTQIWSIAFSPNGEMLASGSEDKEIRLWDVSSGQCVRTLYEHENRIRALAFSPDGQTLVSSGDDRTVKFWDIDEGNCLKTFQGYTNWIWSVVFSPDGQTLASASQDKKIRLWDVQTGQCLRFFEGHTSWVKTLAFSPNGQYLASGADEPTIRLWDVRTGECVRLFEEKVGWVNCLSFSCDGQILASANQVNSPTLKLWDVSTGENLLSLEMHEGGINSIVFTSDGHIISASDDKKIMIWDVKTKKSLRTLEGHNNGVWSIALSQDGRLLASGSHDNTVKLWNIDNGECLLTLQDHRGPVRSVAFSPDNKVLVSGSSSELRLWDTKTGRLIQNFQGHSGAIKSISYGGSLIASGSEDETIKLWNPEIGECLKTMKPDRPYEGMNITEVTGLTEAQKDTLKALGAIENSMIKEGK